MVKCIEKYVYRMGRWSFWSWFDVNLSIFDEDMRDKQFYILVPGDLTFYL